MKKERNPIGYDRPYSGGTSPAFPNEYLDYSNKKFKKKTYFRKMTMKDIITLITKPIKQIYGFRIFKSKK